MTSSEVQYTDPAGSLELRRAGRGVGGTFPYRRTATIKDRGRVRKETFMPGSFSYSIERARDGDADIFLLVGHDFDKPLASMRSRARLELSDRVDALAFEVKQLPDTTYAVETRELIAAGLVAGVSPGFRLPPPDVVPDAERLVDEPGNPGVQIRELHDVRLVELSMVTLPAYRDSVAEVRRDVQRTARRRSVVVL